jgi:hypothetical protein
MYKIAFIIFLVTILQISPNKEIKTTHNYDEEGNFVNTVTIEKLYWSATTWIGIVIAITINILLGIWAFAG